MEMSIRTATNDGSYHSWLEGPENSMDGIMVHLTLEPLETYIFIIFSVSLYADQIDSLPVLK